MRGAYLLAFPRFGNTKPVGTRRDTEERRTAVGMKLKWNSGRAVSSGALGRNETSPISLDGEAIVCIYLRINGSAHAARDEHRQDRRPSRTGGLGERGGTKHAKYRKAGHSPIMVPRHRTVTAGVAKSIARATGWDEFGSRV